MNFARTEDEIVRAAIEAGLRPSESLDIAGDDALTRDRRRVGGATFRSLSRWNKPIPGTGVFGMASSAPRRVALLT